MSSKLMVRFCIRRGAIYLLLVETLVIGVIKFKSLLKL